MDLKVTNKVLIGAMMVMLMAFTADNVLLKNTSIMITTESLLVVRGTTNVSTFTCGFDVSAFKRPISVTYRIENDKWVFDKTALVLNNECFDCGGKTINNDFQNILKSKVYPQITLYLNEITDLENQSNNVLAFIDIEIAGITKKHSVPVKFKKDKDLLITGNLALSMEDYNLIAPKKLFGLITVHDTIKIYFQLAIQEK